MNGRPSLISNIITIFGLELFPLIWKKAQKELTNLLNSAYTNSSKLFHNAFDHNTQVKWPIDTIFHIFYVDFIKW